MDFRSFLKFDFFIQLRYMEYENGVGGWTGMQQQRG
jgi:hypothetical protein